MLNKYIKTILIPNSLASFGIYLYFSINTSVKDQQFKTGILYKLPSLLKYLFDFNPLYENFKGNLPISS